MELLEEHPKVLAQFAMGDLAPSRPFSGSSRQRSMAGSCGSFAIRPPPRI